MRRLVFLSVFFILLKLHSQINYFQQEVNYKIQVELNDNIHFLNCQMELDYTNNSPDTLKFIYFHLWPNAYKNNKSALAKQLLENGNLKMEFMKYDESGWIDSLNFESEGKNLILEFDKKNPDIAHLQLNSPLKPGEKINLKTPFRVKLPSAKISRLGHIGQAYAITQWYPKPAVYDKNGWHQMPYLDQGEFFSEYGSYEVKITLPENYLVGATGDLQEENELNWLEGKISETNRKIMKRFEEFNHKITITDSLRFPVSSSKKKTISFKQSNVHDFAWFADKRFNVLKTEVELPKSKKMVTCWSMFTDNNFELWLSSPEFLHDAIYYYSRWNGDYPYKQVTAVDGTISAGGGMEYPNVTIIGSAENLFDLENVIMHEVGHNWFYGILGSNERSHAWMDEGINSFNELRYVRNKYPKKNMGEGIGLNPNTKLLGINKFRNAYQYYLLYALSARKNSDQPIELSSEKFTEGNYGSIVYSKTAIAFDYLHHYLGEKLFDSCMQSYFDKFKFKHPQPKDLREIFESISGKNLSWFFDDLIKTKGKIDYKIQSISKIKNNENGIETNYKLKIKNSGTIAAPLCIGSLDNPNSIWIEGFSGKKTIELKTIPTKIIAIDPHYIIPEINRRNNQIKTSGILKKIKPIKLNFIGKIDNPDYTALNYFPAIGFNNDNGWMAGLNLSNYFALEQKFNFDITPMYGFGNGELAGFANAQFNFHPKKLFKTVNIGINSRRFTYESQAAPLNYFRVEQFNYFIFKNKNERSKIENKLEFSIKQIGIDKKSFSSFNSINNNTITTEYRSIASLVLSHQNKRALNPYSIKLQWENGNQGNRIYSAKTFSKIWLEANLHYTTNKKNNGFDLRLFAGKTLSYINGIDTRFRMGGIHGYQDYGFDYLFIDRSAYNGLNFQQYIEADGAFKTRMFLGQSNDYLIALNIKSPKALKYFGLFTDIGTCGNDGLFENKFLFDLGLRMEFANNAISIYLPLIFSEDIKSGIDANAWSFGERIMINFRIDKLNPKDYIRNIFAF